jgi:hypothetical protein
MEELEKYKMERELGFELEEIGDLRLAEGEESSQDLVESSPAVQNISNRDMSMISASGAS